MVRPADYSMERERNGALGRVWPWKERVGERGRESCGTYDRRREKTEEERYLMEELH